METSPLRANWCRKGLEWGWGTWGVSHARITPFLHSLIKFAGGFINRGDLPRMFPPIHAFGSFTYISTIYSQIRRKVKSKRRSPLRYDVDRKWWYFPTKEEKWKNIYWPMYFIVGCTEARHYDTILRRLHITPKVIRKNNKIKRKIILDEYTQ